MRLNDLVQQVYHTERTPLFTTRCRIVERLAIRLRQLGPVIVKCINVHIGRVGPGSAWENTPYSWIYRGIGREYDSR